MQLKTLPVIKKIILYNVLTGYGDNDVLNLSSKSDSREDLSDTGNVLCNPLISSQNPSSPSHQNHDKDEPLSDNEFDDDKHGGYLVISVEKLINLEFEIKVNGIYC